MSRLGEVDNLINEQVALGAQVKQESSSDADDLQENHLINESEADGGVARINEGPSEHRIIQAGRNVSKGQYLNRPVCSRRHKLVWKESIRKYKHVKCVYQNCHFLALSVDDMVSHFSSCNGDGSFAKFVCPYCEGRVTSEQMLKVHIQRSHPLDDDHLSNGHALDGDEATNEEDLGSRLDGDGLNIKISDVKSESSYFFDDDNNASNAGDAASTEGGALEFIGNKFPMISVQCNPYDSCSPGLGKLDSGDGRHGASRVGEFSNWTKGGNSRDGVSRVVEVSVLCDKQNVAVDPEKLLRLSNNRARQKEYAYDHIYFKKDNATVAATEQRSPAPKGSSHRHSRPGNSGITTKENVLRRDEFGADGGVAAGVGDEQAAIMYENVREGRDEMETSVAQGTTSSSLVQSSPAGVAAGQKVLLIPCIQTTKRKILKYYTHSWLESIKTNGFARCLVATCNFISLDIYHIQNHFKTCDGIPATGPNLCTLCNSWLPSAIELSIHTSTCRAIKAFNISSVPFAKKVGDKKKKNEDERGISGNEEESNKAAEGTATAKEPSVSKQSCNKSVEASAVNVQNVAKSCDNNCSKNKNSGEVGQKREKVPSLRISDLVKLREEEMSPTRIIQPGPILPVGQYLRRRSYNKQHKAIWEAALQKHKYVKCIFQNCHFLAMSIEDMIYHFGYCIGDGSFAKFECPYCGGRLTSKQILNIHIEISHPEQIVDESTLDELNNYGDFNLEMGNVVPSVNNLKELFRKRDVKTYGKQAGATPDVVDSSDEITVKVEPSFAYDSDSSTQDAFEGGSDYFETKSNLASMMETVLIEDQSGSAGDANRTVSDGLSRYRVKSECDSENDAGSPVGYATEDVGDGEPAPGLVFYENPEMASDAADGDNSEDGERHLVIGETFPDDDYSAPRNAADRRGMHGTDIVWIKAETVQDEASTGFGRDDDDGDDFNAGAVSDDGDESDELFHFKRTVKKAKTCRSNPDEGLNNSLPLEEEPPPMHLPAEKTTDPSSPDVIVLDDTETESEAESETTLACRYLTAEEVTGSVEGDAEPGSFSCSTDNFASSPSEEANHSRCEGDTGSADDKGNVTARRGPGKDETNRERGQKRKMADESSMPDNSIKKCALDEEEASRREATSPDAKNPATDGGASDNSESEVEVLFEMCKHSNQKSSSAVADEIGERPVGASKSSLPEANASEDVAHRTDGVGRKVSQVEEENGRPSTESDSNLTKDCEETLTKKDESVESEKMRDVGVRQNDEKDYDVSHTCERLSGDVGGGGEEEVEKDVSERHFSAGNVSGSDRINCSDSGNDRGKETLKETPMKRTGRKKRAPSPADNSSSEPNAVSREGNSRKLRRSRVRKSTTTVVGSLENPESEEEVVVEVCKYSNSEKLSSAVEEESEAYLVDVPPTSSLADGVNFPVRARCRGRTRSESMRKVIGRKGVARKTPPRSLLFAVSRKEAIGNRNPYRTRRSLRPRAKASSSSVGFGPSENSETEEEVIVEICRYSTTEKVPPAIVDVEQTGQYATGAGNSTTQVNPPANGSNAESGDERGTGSTREMEKNSGSRRGGRKKKAPIRLSTANVPGEKRRLPHSEIDVGNSSTARSVSKCNKRIGDDFSSVKRANSRISREARRKSESTPHPSDDGGDGTSSTEGRSPVSGASSAPCGNGMISGRKRKIADEPLYDSTSKSRREEVLRKPGKAKRSMLPGEAQKLERTKDSSTRTPSSERLERKMVKDSDEDRRKCEEDSVDCSASSPSVVDSAQFCADDKRNEGSRKGGERPVKRGRGKGKGPDPPDREKNGELEDEIVDSAAGRRASTGRVTRGNRRRERGQSVLESVEGAADPCCTEGSGNAVGFTENTPKNCETPQRRRGRPPRKNLVQETETTDNRIGEERPEDEADDAVESDAPAKKSKRGRKRRDDPQPEEGDRGPNEEVKCGKCGLETDWKSYKTHNLKKHYGLGWVEGENPPDLNDEESVTRNVKQAFKVVKSATCEHCGVVKKSALGFTTHLQTCGKSAEEKQAAKVQCPHCSSRILKYSLPMHLKNSHSNPGEELLEVVDTEKSQPTKRKSAIDAINRFKEVMKECSAKDGGSDDDDSKRKAKYKLYQKGASTMPKVSQKLRRLWNKAKRMGKNIACRRRGCRFESSTVDEARRHHFTCPELPDKVFLCQLCDYYSAEEGDVRQHANDHSNGDADFAVNSEDERMELDAETRTRDEMSVDEMLAYYEGRCKTADGAPDENSIEMSHKLKFFIKENIMNQRGGSFLRSSMRKTLLGELEEMEGKEATWPELRTSLLDWTEAPAEKALEAMPSLSDSALFRVSRDKKANGSGWIKLKRFHGDVVEGSPVLFAGGSILSVSWCKASCGRSMSERTKQYLAVSVSKKMDRFQNVHEHHDGSPSIIQIWSFGELKTSKEVTDAPEMVMGIVHNSGEVWDLSWFPVDCYADEDGKHLTRLGVLAAACQDGTVRIWPICDPGELHNGKGFPVYDVDPSVVMELEDRSQEGCLRLAIGRSGILVGGYGNGTVAVWSLTNVESPFGRRRGRSRIVKPHLSFQAHRTSISSLSICPSDDRYIATSGLDRSMKFWDLECTIGPYECVTKEVCLGNVWPKNWPVTVSTFEDIVPCSSKVMMKCVRDAYFCKHRTPVPMESTCWSLSFNEWMNVLCVCNNVGDVKIRYLRNMFLVDEYFRFRSGNIFSKTEMKSLKESVKREATGCDDERDGKSSSDAGGADEDSPIPRTYEEAAEHFGVVFTDYSVADNHRRSAGAEKKVKRKEHSVEEYPMTSVTKVAWNPNFDSFTYLAVGYQSGMIRVVSLVEGKGDCEVSTFLKDSYKVVRDASSVRT